MHALAALGPLLLAAVTTAGVALSLRRGVRRMLLALLGVTLGGFVGATPGAYLFVAQAVRRSTGPGSGAWLTEVAIAVTLWGVAAGSWAGLLGAEALMGSRPRRKPALAAAFGGTAIGAVAHALSLLVAQHRYELAVFALTPFALAASILGVYTWLLGRTPRGDVVAAGQSHGER